MKGRTRPGRRRKATGGAAGPPETLVASCLVARFRESLTREGLRRATGLSDEQIERALLSPQIDAALGDIQQACVRERWPALLHSLFDAAGQGQPWAWRILLETTALGERLRAAAAARPPEESDAFISTGCEQRLLEALRGGGDLAAPDDSNSSASG